MRVSHHLRYASSIGNSYAIQDIGLKFWMRSYKNIGSRLTIKLSDLFDFPIDHYDYKMRYGFIGNSFSNNNGNIACIQSTYSTTIQRVSSDYGAEPLSSRHFPGYSDMVPLTPVDVSLHPKNQRQEPQMIASSFGMNLLMQLQQWSWNTGNKLKTLYSIDITEESFNKLQTVLPSKTVFEHEEGNRKNDLTIEFLGEHFFLAIYRNEDKFSILNFIGTEDIYEIIDNTIQRPPIKPIIHWIDSISNGNFNIINVPVTGNKSFYEEAYPAIGDFDKFLNDYLNSDSAVLLLYGPPGTGKTSLLREMLTRSNKTALLTYSKDIAGLDTLFSHFYESGDAFLIVEDADTYINSRSEDGNDVMKKLLNITDGLTAKPEKKVIFTTNLTDLSHVDPALLREGRCFAAVNINSLNSDQAIKLIEVMGHSKTVLDDQKLPIVLANVYSLLAGREVDQSTKTVKSSFGFG